MTEETKDPGRDPTVSEALAVLDPGSGDPGYWLRFHSRVMAAAREELARRRMLPELTVADLVTSWGRTVVPAAVVAAALAVLLLTGPYPSATVTDESRIQPVALEDMLDEGSAGPGMDVTFASEGF